METPFFIAIGLVGLSIVVFVHELGHFLVAKFFKVEVEAFAVGFGKILWKWKPGTTEYRLCLFPLGGYCKMKGEEFIVKSLENPDQEQTPEPGSFFAVHPVKRILISAAGPVFNLIFAVLVFFALGVFGTEESSVPARIVLTSELPSPDQIPLTAAEKAGLKTGDLVTQVNGQPIRNYTALVEAIQTGTPAPLSLQVNRQGQILTFSVTPQWVESQQRAFIGAYPWIDPVIAGVEPRSSAAIGGLQAGDVITSINGSPVRHKIDMDKVLTPKVPSVVIGYQRKGQSLETRLVPDIVQGKVTLGLNFATTHYPAQPQPPLEAVGKSLHQTATILSATVSGLFQLVSGKLNAGENLSGPLRTSQFIGEVTSTSFMAGWGEGIAAAGGLLAFISIGLFFMNLLPIPALDGGAMVLGTIEALRGKRVKIKTYMRYQQIGFFFIILLIIFVTFNDILHFIPK